MFSETVDGGNKAFSYNNALLLKVKRFRLPKNPAEEVVLKKRGCAEKIGGCGFLVRLNLNDIYLFNFCLVITIL